MDLVLASTSPYRQQLLERLGLPFRVQAPLVDEAPLPGEGPAELVARLALAKAGAVAATAPGALVIGSDQVAVLDGVVMGKPGGHEGARAQLERASGRTVEFLTGLALVRGDWQRVAVVPFRVRFRELEGERIRRYLERERPYDCAGSFKSEGLGIALFRGMEGEDPTALVGLPLIRLVSLLEEAGVVVP